MNCQQFREMLDSYLSDELLVETNHEVLHHLETCALCRHALAARRDLRAQLRAAIRNTPEMRITPAFAARLQADLRETALHPKWWQTPGSNNAFFIVRMLLAASLCVLVIAGFAGIWL